MGEAQRTYWQRRKARRAALPDDSPTCSEAALMARQSERSGEKNGNAKLFAAQVEAIRGSRASSAILALAYDVSKATVERIRRGGLWRT